MVTTKRDPWSKFYWSDWRSDPLLHACSLAARGLWLEMLGLMFEATPQGHLLVKGKPPTDQKLAEMAGAKVSEIRRLKKELQEAGVPDITADGVWISRRMVRDARRRAVNRENGKTGGNPLLTGKAADNQEKGGNGYPKSEGAKVNHSNKSHDARDPEARSQKLDSESPPPPPSPAAARGGEGPATPPDAVAIIRAFDDSRVQVFGAEQRRPWPTATDAVTAKRWLEAGATVDLCRGVFDALNQRWHGEGGTPANSLKACTRWIEAAIREGATPVQIAEPPRSNGHRQAQSGGDPNSEANQWRQRVERFIAGGFWLPERWGPMPNDEGCGVPAEILAEFAGKLPQPAGAQP